MSDQYAMVIASINHSTRAIIEAAHNIKPLVAHLIIIESHKKPSNSAQFGATYLTWTRRLERASGTLLRHQPTIVRARTLAVSVIYRLALQ